MVAKVQKNIEKIRAVEMPRYRVWILCHMVYNVRKDNKFREI